MKQIFCFLMMVAASIANAKDSLEMTCSWQTNWQAKHLISSFTVPEDCITQREVSIFKEKESKSKGYGYANLIRMSNPPSCPPGYEQYGEITGRVEATHQGYNFEARRRCLTTN